MTYKACGQLLLAIFMAAQLALVDTTHAGSREIYQGAVSFAPQIVQLTGGCLWVDGTLTSGNFFKGLERNDQDGVFQYTHRGTALSNYPESVTASIRILDNQCVPNSSKSSLFSSSQDSRPFTFGVDWKTGLQLRPATMAAPRVECVSSTGEKKSPTPPMTCRITVSSAGTPLSDHLIVSVFGSGGERLARISAAP